jgi:hypothetical protein
MQTNTMNVIRVVEAMVERQYSGSSFRNYPSRKKIQILFGITVQQLLCNEIRERVSMELRALWRNLEKQ